MEFDYIVGWEKPNGEQTFVQGGDEVFGSENFVFLITVRKTGGTTGKVSGVADLPSDSASTPGRGAGPR
ncbi:hypothetical protein BH23CHL5_BH23CHL5_08520 [soil metagenome]